MLLLPTLNRISLEINLVNLNCLRYVQIHADVNNSSTVTCARKASCVLYELAMTLISEVIRTCSLG